MLKAEVQYAIPARKPDLVVEKVIKIWHVGVGDNHDVAVVDLKDGSQIIYAEKFTQQDFPARARRAITRTLLEKYGV